MNFISKLMTQLRDLGKGEISKEIRFTKTNITEQVLPVLMFLKDAESKITVAKIMSGSLAKELSTENAPYKAMIKQLPNNLKRLSYFDLIEKAMENLTDLLSSIEDTQIYFFSRTIQVEGINLQVANVIRMVEVAAFFVDHFMTLSSSVFSSAAINTTPVPAIQEQLRKDTPSFVNALGLFLKDREYIMDKINTIPEVIVSETKDSGVSPVEADPLRLNFIGAIYRVFAYGMVDRDIERLRKYQLARQTILSSIERYRLNTEGLPDAEVENRISKWQRELDQVESKIKKIRQE